MLLDTIIDFKRVRCYGLRMHGGVLKSTLGVSALRLAIHSPAIFQVLLDKEIHINSKPYELLMLTTEILATGNLALAQAVLGRGVPVNELEQSLSQGMGSAVVLAAKGGTNMLGYLSARGLLTIEPSDSDVQWAFLEAIGEGSSTVVEYFLERGCRPCREKERTNGYPCLE